MEARVAALEARVRQHEANANYLIGWVARLELEAQAWAHVFMRDAIEELEDHANGY